MEPKPQKPSMSSSVKAADVPKASKWSVRSMRGGQAGDVIWMFSILNMAGTVLKEFEITRPVGEALDKLQPASIVKKVFGCGTTKELEKH